MPRFADAVHLTHPKTHTPVFFMKGEEIPEWAHSEIGAHLIAKIDAAAIASQVAPAAIKLAELPEVPEPSLTAVEPNDDGPLTPGEEVGDDGSTPSEEDDGDYTTWTNTKLRDELIARSLPTGGKKEELVARLEEDDE